MTNRGEGTAPGRATPAGPLLRLSRRSRLDRGLALPVRHHMLRFARQPTPPIGVDVGSDGVRMLQVRASDVAGRFSVTAAIQLPFPDDVRAHPERRVAAAGELIRRGLREGGFIGRRVVAALPREIVHLRTLRLPPMPEADLAWAVSAEAQDLLPFDPAHASLQFLDAGDVRQGGEPRREVIVVAACDKDVEEFLSVLHNAGADVASLDVEPCAGYRSVARAAAGAPDAVRVVLEVGASRSQVVIGRGPAVRVIKGID